MIKATIIATLSCQQIQQPDKNMFVVFCEVSHSAVNISLATDKDAYTLHTHS